MVLQWGTRFCTLSNRMTVQPFALLPDSELIEACLKGRSQAWEALLVRYQRLIYSIPMRYGLPEHDANDIFQNVSLLLWENLGRIRDRARLGSSSLIPPGPENPDGKGFDRMCDPTYTGNQLNGNNMTGALPGAPVSGRWFQAQFVQLVQNAFPPFQP